jgi:N6-adenosine-specific RNA methylase IME4
MNGLAIPVPASVPQARKALAAMEKDIDAAMTYAALRKLERQAEAIKALYREYVEVGRDAERVILIAKHRTGQELRQASVNRGAATRSAERTASPPTIAEQVGSKQRGHRLKKLAEVTRHDLLQAAAKLWEAGKEATQSAVLKLIAGDERKAKRADYEARAERGCEVADLVAMAEAGRRFNVIYADPPWEFKVYSGKGKDRSAERHYDTQSLEALKALPVGALAADNCALFLWCVWPEFPGALEVIRAWGFEYKTAGFVWVKQNRGGEGLFTGMGYWTRANTEPCLLATRGSPERMAMDVHQVIMAPVAEHSRKPDETRTRIERLINGPYLELFARAPVPGWTVWGNEVEASALAAE